jgi:hypothetical protein
LPVDRKEIDRLSLPRRGAHVRQPAPPQ